MKDNDQNTNAMTAFPNLPKWSSCWRRTGFNGSLEVAAEALRHLAENERPIGGQSMYNAEHLHQVANELDITRRDLLEPVDPLICSELAAQGARAAAQDFPAITLNSLAETLWAVGIHLGIDFDSARQTSGKPSDVLISAIDAYAEARRRAAFAMLDRNPAVRQVVQQAWCGWFQSDPSPNTDENTLKSSEEGFIAGVAWMLEKLKDHENSAQANSGAAQR